MTVAFDPNNVEAFLKLWEYQCYTYQLWDALKTRMAMEEIPDAEEKIDQYIAGIARTAKYIEIALYVSIGLTAVLVGLLLWKRREK